MNAPLSFFNCCIALHTVTLSVQVTSLIFGHLPLLSQAQTGHRRSDCSPFPERRKALQQKLNPTICGSPVSLTCGKSDGRLPLKVSYPATCSHQEEVATHLISQNRDAYASLLIDPGMVNLGDERHLGRISNVCHRAVIQPSHTVGGLNGKSSGSASLK